MKSQLLSHLTPACIHKEMQDHRIRISSCDFSSWRQYRKHYDRDFAKGRIVYENGYYDQWAGEEAEFYNVIEQQPAYYLFYDLGTEHTPHTPIDEAEVKQYKQEQHLDIITFDEPLITYGDDTNELVPVQFVRKVITSLMNGTARVCLNG